MKPSRSCLCRVFLGFFLASLLVLVIYLALPHENQHIINAIRRGDATEARRLLLEQVQDTSNERRHIWSLNQIYMGVGTTF